MEHRQNIRSASRREQECPADTLPASLPLTKASREQQQQGQERAGDTPAANQVSHEQEGPLFHAGPALSSTKRELSEFSQVLSSILYRDRRELRRVAQGLAISENSVYRWMNGQTEPRIHHLRRLPELLPAHRERLTEAIHRTFHGVLQMQTTELPGTIGEVPKDIYQRVVELISITDESDARLWEVSQALFEHALYHLDRGKQGIAITYAHLLSAHEDGIHALREAAMRGHEPWPMTLESKVYLGSTSLAGTAATLQRMQIWAENERENRLQAEIDEYEKSACAVPVARGRRIAGVLIISSTSADFFRQPVACQAVEEYARLLALALPETDFHPFALLHLRPMPGLAWQRAELKRSYAQRIVAYARRYQSSRQEAEHAIQREIELEFEKVGQAQQQSQAEHDHSMLFAF